MTAYVIIDVNITDPKGYEKYLEIGGPTVTNYGGKFVVAVGAHAGGKIETLEGDWRPKHIVIIEFEDIAQATKWFSSPEYAKANEIRQNVAQANFIVVENE